MIKVEKIEVWGFEHAIRGMRNPKNSWDKSDSEEKYWCTDLGPDEEPHYCNNCNYDMCHPYDGDPVYVVGQNDLGLMHMLYVAGPEHRKYLRQIFVSMDITAPLYWWKEFDTYKVGTTADSCSTMHKIHAKEFEYEDFSHEHLATSGRWLLGETIKLLNKWRDVYIKGNPVYPPGNKKIWWQMIQSLPSSYNQKRTVTFTYENVVTMIRQRTGHKLDEWRNFVDILKDLPYVREIMDE